MTLDDLAFVLAVLLGLSMTAQQPVTVSPDQVERLMRFSQP